MRSSTQCTVIHLILLIVVVVVVHNPGETLADEERISDYIRRCCISGLRQARTANSCENVSEVNSIPALWLGLCHSTFEVCCSREVDHLSCELGRLAAIEGARCNKFPPANSSSTTGAYADCCRACQVGLAVKASQQNCRDPLFSFLSAIESYRLCCDDAESYFPNYSGSKHRHQDENIPQEGELPILSGETADGTIVLTGDNNDICGEIPNLCAQICENTVEAYECKCHPGFQLDENNVTCSAISEKKNLCPNGYRLDGMQGKCVDIDECKEQLHECKTTQYCHNTIGGYHCLNVKTNECSSGYHFDEKSEECKDDNECEQSPSPCDADQECTNYPGGYKCIKSLLPSPNTLDSSQCGSGFYLKDDGSCVDIDECAQNTTNNCHIHLHKECRNTLGSFFCHCQAGYSLDVTQDRCVDINECSINNHNCLPTQRCDNTIGSYICTRLQSCGTGYTLNAETGICDDDDECALGTHNCPISYDCYNTKGSFRCHRKTTTSTTTTTTTTSTTIRPPLVEKSPNLRYPYGGLTSRKRLPCATGFNRNHLGACVDINECYEGEPCGSHERCINTNGHYRCESLLQCSGGYKSTPDGTSCIDIDECETGEHNCGDTQKCLNRNGGYICACHTGHQMSRLSTGLDTCVDINECTSAQRVCPSNANCFNTIGSYYCECKSGFEKKTDNSQASGDSTAQCFDVDECEAISGLCQQKCVNFWGGYRCSCHMGYQLGQDNRTCNDIDECEVHKDYKLCMGSCVNTAGSYQCSCPRGYTLAADEKTCRDIDECEGSTENHVCTGRHDICTNIRGSFKCTTINCPYGYMNDPEQKNRCRQKATYCEGEDCYTKPSAYTYNFITFVSKLMVPPDGRTIFTLRGPIWYNNIEFDLKIVRIQAAPNIERATESHFDTLKSNNQVNLLLKRALDGPQDIELELSMTVFTTNAMPRGKSVAKLFLFVSQYPF
ncbi:LOW QUALITY PROTEIN: uncharacterized protein Dwil_GK13673, partial [Drosophila willistoni]